MSQLAELIQQIDELKNEIESLRPISWEQEQRIMQKFRLDWNYHSNAIEGNTLTYGETKAFLLHGITAQGKPFRDYLDIKGHQAAIEFLQDFIRGNEPLTESYIRELHKTLLIESYEMDAVTPDGFPTKRRIEVGRYKSAPNSVKTSTGEFHIYASPEETPAKMGDLMRWYRDESDKKQSHPLLIAALFHLRFVQIHPFDDGNGRMARLLMNLILMEQGYVPVIINTNSKPEYLLALEKADRGDESNFIELIATNLVYSLDLFIRGAKGENIEDLDDLDKRIRILQRRLESEGKIEPIVRSLPTQIHVYENVIQPLITRLLERIRKLEIFFKWVEYGYSYFPAEESHTSTNARFNANDGSSLVNEIGRLVQTNSQFLLVTLTIYLYYIYEPLSGEAAAVYGSSIHSEALLAELQFRFDNSKVFLRYSYQDLEERAHMGKVFTNLSSITYTHIPSKNEINKLVHQVVEPILITLEDEEWNRN